LADAFLDSRKLCEAFCRLALFEVHQQIRSIPRASYYIFINNYNLQIEHDSTRRSGFMSAKSMPPLFFGVAMALLATKDNLPKKFGFKKSADIKFLEGLSVVEIISCSEEGLFLAPLDRLLAEDVEVIHGLPKLRVHAQLLLNLLRILEQQDLVVGEIG
jgi:hypothetical protein